MTLNVCLTSMFTSEDNKDSVLKLQLYVYIVQMPTFNAYLQISARCQWSAGLARLTTRNGITTNRSEDVSNSSSEDVMAMTTDSTAKRNASLAALRLKNLQVTVGTQKLTSLL